MSKTNWDDVMVISGWDGKSAHEHYHTFKLFKESIQSLPKKVLIERGWINDKNDYLSLYEYFKTLNWQKNTTLFRKMDGAETSTASVWMSKIKSSAQIISFSPNISKFSGLNANEMSEIAKLSVDPNNIKELPRILLNKGIILVYERALPNMKLDGVVFKLSSENPVIGLSFRFPRLDNFWFTLMHELAHISLHSELLREPIADNIELHPDSEIELSADRLAKQSIVDRASWRACKAKYTKDIDDIKSFAKKMHIHPSLVAGLLRRETGDYSLYGKLVNEINVRELVFGND